MNARIHTERLANPDGDLVHFLDAVLRQETTTSIAEDSPLLFDAGEDVVRRVVRDAEGHVVSHAAARIAVYRSGMHAQSIAIIGAVATAPKHRNRGIATAVLHDLIDDLKGRGVAFVVLWSDVPGFYEPMGFTRAGVELLVEVPRRLHGVAKSTLVRPMEPDDLDVIAEIHAREPHVLVRSASEWKRLVGIPRCDVYVLEAFGQVEAYGVVGKGHDLGGCLHEWGGPSRHLPSLVGGITALRRESALWVMSAPWRRDALAPFAAMGLQIHEGVLGMVKALHAEIPKDLYLFGLDSN